MKKPFPYLLHEQQVPNAIAERGLWDPPEYVQTVHGGLYRVVWEVMESRSDFRGTTYLLRGEAVRYVRVGSKERRDLAPGKVHKLKGPR